MLLDNDSPSSKTHEEVQGRVMKQTLKEEGELQLLWCLCVRGIKRGLFVQTIPDLKSLETGK